MRELRFRAWDGVAFYSPFIDSQGRVYRSLTDLIEADNALNDTVQEYTGLMDRDNQELWEGDIARFVDPWNAREVIGEICFCEGEFAFRLGDEVVESLNGLINNARVDCKKLGNVHENPELLEVTA